MMMQEYYQNKVCVVTGAAAGIGYAVCKKLLQIGATVFMADIDVNELKKAVDALSTDVGKGFAAPTDVTKPEQVQKLIQDAAVFKGHLDFLFNNAGIGATMPFETVTLDTWKKVINLNLWSVIYGVDAAIPIMRKQGFGHIVNTSSIAGIVPPPYQAVYSTTKYAVTGLTECLRYEFHDEGVNFTTVCPGNVVSSIWKGMEVPADAMPADEAAQIILEGVAKKEGMIVFSDTYKELYMKCRMDPAFQEKVFLDLARERRENYKTKGSYI